MSVDLHTPLSVRVSVITRQTDEISSFELTPLTDVALPPFTAGAHIDVATGPHGVRQYSLCNAPSERQRYVLGVKRENPGRGGSRWLHEQVKAGDVLQISAPRNNFALTADATAHLLLAGGIGLTPMLAMARALWQDGKDFQLCCFARSPDHLAFAAQLREAPWRDRIRYHFDNAGIDDVQARIDLTALLAAATPGTHLYMCGPQGFMDAVRAAASAWPEEQVHLEYFSAAAVLHEDGDRPFEVSIASSGQVFTVGSSDSIAQVLLDNGIDILTSCEQGVCGTCVTPYLEGLPEHRDYCLSKKERDSKVALCCARSRTGRLVLDL